MRIRKILNQVGPHLCWGLFRPFIRCEGMKWIILRGNSRVTGPKYMFHIGYEPTYLYDLVCPKVGPCPWSSRDCTCWTGIVLNSSWPQLSRSKMLCTPWKCTHCLRAMPGSLVGSCPNKVVSKCYPWILILHLELLFFLI